MNFERSRPRAVLLAASLTILGACAGFRRGETWQDDTDGAADTAGTGMDETGGATTGDGVAMSFVDDVYPRLVDGCQQCHSEQGSASTTSYLVTDDVDETFEATVEIVDLDAPADSRLLRKARGDGHGGGAVFDAQSEDYQAILTWIEQGAQP
jgi:hypothetical protein